MPAMGLLPPHSGQKGLDSDQDLLAAEFIFQLRWSGKACKIADDFGIVWAIQLVESVSRLKIACDLALRKYDILVVVDLDDLIVELIADEGVSVAQAHGTCREWGCDATHPRISYIRPHHGIARI